MKKGGRIFVLLGLVLAVIAAGGVYFALMSATPETTAPKTIDVLMAVQGINAKSQIAAEQVQTMPWPEGVPTPAGALAQPTEAAGQFAVVAVLPGQAITKDMLIAKEANQDTHGYASLLVPPGSVAMAFQVGPTSNVADAIQAGDRVDIIATFTVQPASATGQPIGTTQTKTQRLLADVLVMNIGSWPPPGNKGAAPTGESKIITFELKEQDALVLQHAVQKADMLNLVLRASHDHEVTDLEPINIEYIDKRFGFKFGSGGQ